MSALEVVLSVLAPHACLVCGRDGRLVCDYCAPNAFLPVPSRCYGCKRLTTDFSTCPACRRQTSIKHVFVQTEYEKTAKQLVYALKFKRARAGASVMAAVMVEALPYLDADTLVIPVPTATKRARQRGYDQAELLAKTLAARQKLSYGRALNRLTQSRQVGSGRQQRREQLKTAFYVSKPEILRGRKVLLVDDVVTTGATLEAAARAARRSGAKSVSAVVFASKQ